MRKNSRGGPKVSLPKELAYVDWNAVTRRALLVVVLGVLACSLAIIVSG